MKKIFFTVFCIICFGVINSAFGQEVNNTSAIGTDYKTAVGIRLSNNAPIVGNAITLKHFLNDKTAIEGFLSFSDPLSLGALLEIHKPLSTPGLRWFYGAGAYLGFGKEYDVNKQRNVNTTYFGGQGVVVIPSKLHGFTRSHEAMAGRCRPTARYGTFYLDYVEATVIPVPT